MFKKIIVALIFVGTLNVEAHVGHDQTPGSIKANHGGVVKAGADINLEYVVTANEVKFFPADHDGKDLATEDVQFIVKTKLPKGKPVAIKTESMDGVVIAKIDFKKSYRIEMIVEAVHKGKKSNFKFQVEK